LDNPIVYYDISPHSNISSYAFNSKPEMSYMTELQIYTNRFIYYAFLNVAPSTTYYFTIADNGNIIDKVSNRTFKTTPNNSSPIQFISGGDTGINVYSDEVFMEAARFNPAFITIGGDIGYVNGIPACYRKMDIWLDKWEKFMVTPSGLMIPMIVSIGNHEAGGIGRTVDDDVFFLNYFVHQHLNGKTPKSLPTFREHYIGSDMALLVLDSYIIAPPDGIQRAWMNSTLYSLKHINNIHNIFTLYHIGLYPSSRDPKNIPHTILRASWTDLFDQYVKIAFENHDHMFKRTFPMKNGSISDNGTIYLGDGAMGVENTPINGQKYLAKVLRKHFFHFIEYNNTNLKITGIDENGQTFDEINLPSNIYL